ncbi:MAG: glycosyltransferase family 4 protein [Pirellulales bacterium]|nr:glycosyltransferase family 4 protein [Pirellulales bacterium]
MKVLALVEGASHVCYRYRIEAFAWAMAERGFLLETEPLDRGMKRLAQLRKARSADVVILQRKLLPTWQLALLRRWAKRLVFDVDDAVFQRDSYSRKPPESWSRLLCYWATIQAADAVIVGNAYLERRTAVYVDAQRVCLVPTCVEPRRYTMALHRRRGGAARLAWIGQESMLPSLDRAAECLRAAAARAPGLRLRAICSRYPTIDGVRVEGRPWSSATEAAELADGDVGVNWLPDDAWSRGKCGLKVLQYMAAGLPVVANPVGMNREMVVHGETGFLASSPREWAEAIGRLADDPALRRRMGAAGRRQVEEHFNATTWAERFAGLVEAIALGRAPSSIEETDDRKECDALVIPSEAKDLFRADPSLRSG